LGCLLLFILLYQQEGNLLGFVSKESVITTIQLEQDYSKVKEGDTILIGITLVKLGGGGTKDYLVTMFLEDAEGLKKSISSQTIAVETRASLVMELDIPKISDSESYLLHVEVRDSHDNKLISSVSQRVILFKDLYIKINYRGLLFVILIALVVLIILLVIIWRNSRISGKKALRAKRV